MNPDEKPIEWIASAKKDLLDFPEEVIRQIGFSLGLVQLGRTPMDAKPLSGIGSGVWELVEDQDGDTYRAVYVVRFTDAIYVLHCFQKKSKSGISTPRPDVDLIRSRLKAAESHYRQRAK